MKHLLSSTGTQESPEAYWQVTRTSA